MRFLRVLISSLWLGGCSGAQLLNDLSTDPGLLTAHGIAYGPSPRNRLDVYAPATARGAPVVVFFYGGSWQNGSKADYGFLAKALAQSGIVVVIPDYRVYPEVKFAGFMQDGAAVVAWARRNAAQYGGDPSRLVLMGHSAGAHIAAMLTLDRRWLAAKGLDPSRDLAGMVGLSGPYDFLPLKDPILDVIFGPPARLAETQPINFADGRNPPMFLGTGGLDTTVYPRNTYGLAERIRQHGGPVEVRTYPALGHATLIGAVSQPLGFVSTVRRDVASFILALPPRGSRVAAQ